VDDKKTLRQARTVPAKTDSIPASADSTPTVSPGLDDAQTVSPMLTASSEEGAVTPEAAGRYTIQREYGRGGQSRVLLAFDQHLLREIALKELLGDVEQHGTRTASQAASARFVREARITGQLEHPNIVPVYELGAHADGSVYYTQKLVRGTTLKAKLSECREAGARLSLLAHFADICHAVAYAHSRGVIHRDLKPENVMVGQFGETVVLDWGLAKAHGQKDLRGPALVREATKMRADATMEGYALGTPSYMSPEQAQGHLEEIDERSDVWSLGAILFELLTGRPPFQGDTAFSIIGKVIKGAPPHCREVARTAPPELAAVADKCLTRDAKQRYGNAEEIAREIEAYQAGGDVRAYRYSSWELLRRFVQKHRALTAVTGLALLLLFAALLTIREEAAQAKTALALARHNLAQAWLTSAHVAEHDFFWHKAEIFYAAARVQEDGPEARWGSVIEAADAAGVTRLAGPQGWVLSAAFSPDGKTVLLGGGDGVARILDLDSGRELWRLTATQPIDAVAFSPDGKHVATRDTAGLVRLHDLAGALLSSVTCALRGPGSLAFVGDKLYASCSPALSLDGPLTFSAQRLASCGPQMLLEQDGLVRLGAVQLEVPPGAHEIACGGTLVAVSGPDLLIRLFDQTGKPLGVLPGHNDHIAHVAVSHDGKRVASASSDRTVRLWSAEHLQQRALLPRSAPALWVDFAADGQTLAVGEQQNSLLLWDVSVEHGATASFTFLPSGGYLATNSAGELGRYTQDGELESHLAEEGPVVDLALQGNHLAAVLQRGDVGIWDLSINSRTRNLNFEEPARQALYLPDGSLLVRLASNKLRLRAPSGEQRELGNFGEIADWSAAKNALYLRLATGKLLRVDLQGGPVQTLPQQSSSFAISPDGSRLAVGSAGRILLFDDKLGWHGELLMEGAVATSLAFSPNAALLAAAGADGAAHLYNLADGAEVARLPVAGATQVGGLAFSPDGALLRLRAEGSTSALGGVRFLRLGDPSRLAKPGEALRDALSDHGVELDGIALLPLIPPVQAVSALPTTP
jgi:WD40 repeat protein/tRNA A-37 threonylcarbamoyl transferase component Bud32